MLAFDYWLRHRADLRAQRDMRVLLDLMCAERDVSRGGTPHYRKRPN